MVAGEEPFRNEFIESVVLALFILPAQKIVGPFAIEFSKGIERALATLLAPSRCQLGTFNSDPMHHSPLPMIVI